MGNCLWQLKPKVWPSERKGHARFVIVEVAFLNSSTLVLKSIHERGKKFATGMALWDEAGWRLDSLA